MTVSDDAHARAQPHTPEWQPQRKAGRGTIPWLVRRRFSPEPTESCEGTTLRGRPRFFIVTSVQCSGLPSDTQRLHGRLLCSSRATSLTIIILVSAKDGKEPVTGGVGQAAGTTGLGRFVVGQLQLKIALHHVFLHSGAGRLNLGLFC